MNDTFRAYMPAYLVLFYEEMIDLKDYQVQEWLANLSRKGKVLSIEALENNSTPATVKSKADLKGFAIISAHDDTRLDKVIKECAKLDIKSINVYKIV